MMFLLLIPHLQSQALSVSANAAVVINGDTLEVLYSKNCDTRLPMASTTKIMTALLLCESGNLDKEITVTKEMVSVEGSSMGLLPGDTVSLRGLLYGMMLASGNDAANSTAIIIGGTVEHFVELMNKRASEMGLKDTHFETPSGLDGENHYTTARELAIIASEALKNKDFAAAAAAQYESLYYGNPPYRRTLKNHNRLLKTYDGLVGVKTGFTKKSGRCLVTAARKDGKFVIAVTLNAPDDWQDHKTLLDYGLGQLQVVEVSNENTYSVDCADAFCSGISCKSDKVLLSITSKDKIYSEISLPKFLYLPIKKGEKIGEVKIFDEENQIFMEDIVCSETVNTPQTDIFTEFKNIFLYLLSFI